MYSASVWLNIGWLLFHTLKVNHFALLLRKKSDTKTKKGLFHLVHHCKEDFKTLNMGCAFVQTVCEMESHVVAKKKKKVNFSADLSTNLSGFILTHPVTHYQHQYITRILYLVSQYHLHAC